VSWFNANRKVAERGQGCQHINGRLIFAAPTFSRFLEKLIEPLWSNPNGGSGSEVRVLPIEKLPFKSIYG